MEAKDFVREWDLLWSTYSEVTDYDTYQAWRAYLLDEICFTVSWDVKATSDYNAGKMTYYAYLRLYGWLGAGDPSYYIADKYGIQEGVAGKFILTTTVSPSLSGNGVTLAPSGGLYDPGTVVTLTAVPAEGYAFLSWSGDVVGKSNPTTVTMDKDKGVTAAFQAVTSTPTDMTSLLSGVMVIAVLGMLMGMVRSKE